MKTNLLPLRFSAVVAGLLAAANFALADNELWVGIPGTTATTNWSDPSNWSGTSKNPNDNTVYFINNGPTLVGTVNSVVDTSTNCYSLNFTNTSTTHTILIQPGQTLTIDGNNGGVALNANPLGAVITTNTITGANGTLLITGASAGGVFVAVTNTSTSDLAPVLDLSGLGNFIISNTVSTATMQLGDGANRSDGVLFLARTNYLKLPATGTGNSSALVIGDNTSNNGSSPGGVLNLGQTNQIFADNIGVGLSKQTVALMRFNPAFTNANPVVYIRGNSATAVKNWAIGDGLLQTGTSVGGSGTVDLRNGTVNAIVTTMWLGKPSPVSVSAPVSSGTLWFSAGSISVGTLTNGMMTTSQTNEVATGNINLTGSGTLTVNTMVMAVYTNSNPGSSTGTLNITNGTVAVGTLSVGTGTSTSTVNLNNGTFIVTNTCGSTAAPLTALNLTGGTLQLSINGAVNVTNIVATSVGTNGGPTTITIGSIAGVTTATTFSLLKYTGTDPFGNMTLLTPLPNSFTGVLVDDSARQTIDINITPPVAAAPIVWVGATNSVLVSNWETITTNWLDLATRTVPTAYQDLDPVQFDDTASNNVVTLLTNLAPFSILVTNNALNYTFNGPGFVSGITSLIKNGPGSLTLAESGGDSFNGGILVSNGTMVLDNAGSGISGGLNLAAGTVQVGNNDANGSLPAGTILDNGALIFDRSDTLTISTAISGAGTVTKNANNTLTLSGGNSFAGGLLVNAGTLRLGSSTAQGAGTITVTNTGTLVLGTTNLANNIVLSGGTLGEAASLNPLTNNLTTTAGTTSIIYEADPQNLSPGDASEMAWSNTLSGSGSIIVVTVTNDATADSGNGFRLKGTGASFSGTITFSNGVKGELQTTVAGPSSPAGTGTIQLLGGTYLGNNSTSNNLGGGAYTEFNLRNNSSGDTVLGNDVTILGSGFTTLDPLGTAPVGAAVTMGNLTVGGGQEVGVYLAAGSNPHVIVFPTVMLTGGTATFSPKTPGFGATTSAGSDLSFGNISESAPSSIVMNGLLTLTFTGTCTYSGSTTISNGVLALTGGATIANTPNIQIAGGATFDVSGLSSTFTLGAGQTLSGLAATGTLAGNATLAAGAVALNYTSGTPTLTVANGTLTLNNNPVTVTVIGTALPAGSYKIVSASAGGAVAGSVAGSTVNVLGAGVSPGALTTLTIVGNELYLVVNHAPTANSVTYNRGSVNSWQIPVANLLTNASDVDGDTLSLTGVGTSTNGVTLAVGGGYVSYLNTNLVNDQFSYTVADGHGGSATGTVTLLVTPFATGPNATVTISGSSAMVSFAGIPGYKYGVQRSTNLVDWVTLQTTNAPANGIFNVTDDFTDLGSAPSTAYYRLLWNGN